MRELTDFAVAYRSRTDVTAIILRGADSFFSAGAELNRSENDSGRDTMRPETLLELRQTLLAGPDLCKAWEELEPVSIAAIEGYCIGGAVALVLCCDFRIIGRSATMRLPEVPLGINMSWRSIPRLVSTIGLSRAKRFTIFGEPTPSDELMRWGMADECVEDGRAYDTAFAWASRLTTLPPLPVRMTKESANASAHALHNVASFMDRDQYLLTAMSEDFEEGVRAFFDKRQPRFTGR